MVLSILQFLYNQKGVTVEIVLSNIFQVVFLALFYGKYIFVWIFNMYIISFIFKFKLLMDIISLRVNTFT